LKTVSVITGGAGGMGLATAKIIGQEHGVVVCDVNVGRLDAAAQELRSLGVECETVVCDVKDRKSVDDAAERARALGSVVSVVHTAGLSPQMGTVEQIVAVNALGTVHVNEAFVPSAGEGFSIVNVASVGGHMRSALVSKRTYALASTDPDRFLQMVVSRCNRLPSKIRRGLAYAISKNFVIWWSKELAAPLGAKGARIVSVSPGSIDTEMGRLEKDKGAGALADHSALGRFGRVEEIAEVLAFCASDKPGYLTGTDLLVDGGGQKMSAKETLATMRNL
jgi:NAD(P)-dependent dehydrogenase (short-subunit alcohol dehydrogenase family)